MKILGIFFTLLMGAFSPMLLAQQRHAALEESLRPTIHFAPRAHWINDPNGMILLNGTYHLFFQYHPASSVWGPMHWGHATSKDLLHWVEQPIALYPDSLGYIFSGSTVLDLHNTSGLGQHGIAPLIAIFTHHDPRTEGRNDFQYQSIAYSLDEGQTWKKYAGNPVLPNPGITDFRDPKVRWYEKNKQWVMTLATKDCVTFYTSTDLLHWQQASVFGKEEGAHGGVWECPDLFPLAYNGNEYWVLTVNMNPGGPNKGSGIQYFVGHFDGRQFVPIHSDIRWLDYGPDNYAGVTFSNTGKRLIQIGWMSNWDYAEKLPTQSWRNSMTIPRELSLYKIGQELRVRSLPIAPLIDKVAIPNKVTTIDRTKKTIEVPTNGQPLYPSLFKIEFDAAKKLEVELFNKEGERTIIGYDPLLHQFYLDRDLSGIIHFHSNFVGKKTVPRVLDDKKVTMLLVIDAGSVELFADGGTALLTGLNFPQKPYQKIKIHASTMPEGRYAWISLVK